jgi:hypothetical protein
MRLNPLNVMLFQSGFIIIVGLITIMVMPFVVSGDSTTQRQSATMPLLTPPSKEIR